MKISIITPSFNQSEWLRLCMGSIADQISSGGTNARPCEFSVEHIVQDGGSNDASIAILEEWRQKTGMQNAEIPEDPRALPANPYSFYYRSEADTGMYDAINKGLKKASGDILAWLNCDEQYLPGALASVADFFQKNPQVEVAFGDALLLGEDFQILSYRTTVLPVRSHVRLVHLNTPSCATFFRRSVVQSGHLLGQEWKTIGDAVWMEKMLKKKVPMSCLGYATSSFQFTGQNLGASRKAEEEIQQWSTEADAPPSWMRYPVKLRHWLRKWVSGAYKKRSVSTALYTFKSPTVRLAMCKEAVGQKWPTPPALRDE